jgi:hypothetical protein
MTTRKRQPTKKPGWRNRLIDWLEYRAMTPHEREVRDRVRAALDGDPQAQAEMRAIFQGRGTG